MSLRSDIEAKTEKLLEPIIKEKNFELVDVEYVKEGSDYFLRAYIDKEGGININDCEAVSRLLEAKLDEENFIKDAYILEVSSPGLTRPLKKEKDYVRNKGKLIEVHTFKAIDSFKEFIGILEDFDAEKIVMKIDDELIEIERKNISVIKQYFEF